MDFLNFLIAVTALIIAILAYQQSAKSRDLKTRVNFLRDITADALSRMEKTLRKEPKQDEHSPDQPSSK